MTLFANERRSTAHSTLRLSSGDDSIPPHESVVGAHLSVSPFPTIFRSRIPIIVCVCRAGGSFVVQGRKCVGRDGRLWFEASLRDARTAWSSFQPALKRRATIRRPLR